VFESAHPPSRQAPARARVSSRHLGCAMRSIMVPGRTLAEEAVAGQEVGRDERTLDLQLFGGRLRI
jgi:hypothetical protein